MSDPRRALELAYRDTFEIYVPGQVVLEHLCNRFIRRPPLDGSADSMNRTVILAAQREVIDYIVRQIARANNVPEVEPEEGESTDG